MDYTHLGRAGLQVSRLCLGTMTFGRETIETVSHKRVPYPYALLQDLRQV